MGGIVQLQHLNILPDCKQSQIRTHACSCCSHVSPKLVGLWSSIAEENIHSHLMILRKFRIGFATSELDILQSCYFVNKAKQRMLGSSILHYKPGTVKLLLSKLALHKEW